MYKFFDVIALYSLRRIKKFHFWLINKNHSKQSIDRYKLLIPNDSTNSIAYEHALREAFENPRVKNIAICGANGAGKSSFIRTFEKNNPEYAFLDISLAKFNNKENKENLSLIEKSILEQMFYRVKGKKIPQSRFKKINRLFHLPLKTFFVFSIVLSYFSTFHPKLIEKMFVFNFLFSFQYSEYVTNIILVLGALYAIYKIIFFISNIHIEKISFQNLELKSNSNDASLLNQYLDEILYFFEKTKFDVVIFQDLDRFNNLEIFTKLRELNNFINNSEQMKRKVVFVYAIKDEIFEDPLERVKFFDFLIPIIPYINSNNSKDKLLKYFKSEVDNHKIEQLFLYDISLHISDMRLLKNIYNEYLVYKEVLHKKLDAQKLLAIIIYKNFEPQDFQKLHQAKGFVYEVFNTKQENIKLIIETSEKKEQQLQKQIEAIQNEPRKDCNELRSLYIFEIIKKSGDPYDYDFYINSPRKKINLFSCVEDANKFEQIKESESIDLIAQGYNRKKQIKFKEIENTIGNYAEREQLIINKMNGKIDQIKQEINELKNNRKILKLSSLKEMIEQYGCTTIVKNASFENKAIMQYLLIHGYIDENYEDYISYFFEGSLSRSDKDFLINIKENDVPFAFNYHLKNIKEIIKFRLSINEFRKKNILNLSLVDYLIKDENKKQYNEQITALFTQLADESSISKEFILFCLENTDHRSTFIELITQHYRQIVIYLFDEALLTNEQKKGYFNALLLKSDLEIFTLPNAKSIISDFIVTVAYIPESKQNYKPFQNLIEQLETKYVDLDLKTDKEMIDFIFNNQLYKLNIKMIENYFEYFAIDSAQLKSANFTTIKAYESSTTKKLMSYILTAIDQYVSDVFLELPDNNKESKDCVIELLNMVKLNTGLKRKIIEKEDTQIDFDDVADPNLWGTLIKNNKIIPSWHNVGKYFNNKELDQNLLFDYLNNKKIAEIISQIKCNDKKTVDNALLLWIFENEQFSDLSYEYLIKSIAFTLNGLNLSQLNNDKLSLLISLNKLSFDQINFDQLKEKGDHLHIDLIKMNVNKLLENFEKFTFDEDDIKHIMKIDKSILPLKLKKQIKQKLNSTLL